MSDERSSNGFLLPDSERLRPFGCFLRSTSIDELPGLINILYGDMSFVGPRPLLMQYLPLYSPHQARRHLVKPGFSGWAQVNGRNAISWTEKFCLDVWYVDHQSFVLDLRILFLTILKVLRGKVLALRVRDNAPIHRQFSERLTSLLILGAGGHAKVVAETAVASGLYTSSPFLMTYVLTLRPVLMFWIGQCLAISLWRLTRIHIHSLTMQLSPLATLPLVFIGLGNCRLSVTVCYPLHPTAWVSPSAQLGQAQLSLRTLLCKLILLSVQALFSIQDAELISTRLADGVHICPGANLAGEVHVGERGWIGLGASVIQQICIGSDVLVGAGAAVVRDVPNKVTVVGVPARVVLVLILCLQTCCLILASFR